MIHKLSLLFLKEKKITCQVVRLQVPIRFKSILADQLLLYLGYVRLGYLNLISLWSAKIDFYHGPYLFHALQSYVLHEDFMKLTHTKLPLHSSYRKTITFDNVTLSYCNLAAFLLTFN